MKISISQYATTLYELTQDKSKSEIDAVVKKFAGQLIKSRKNRLSGKIIEKFNWIYNQKNGIVEADVITRYKIQDTMTKQIEKFVKEKYKAKEVVIKNKIDENIKGGIIIKVGDEIIDASISGKLRKLENILTK